MRFGIERERKFLAKRMPRRFIKNGGREITQWYICLKQTNQQLTEAIA